MRAKKLRASSLLVRWMRGKSDATGPATARAFAVLQPSEPDWTNDESGSYIMLTTISQSYHNTTWHDGRIARSCMCIVCLIFVTTSHRILSDRPNIHDFVSTPIPLYASTFLRRMSLRVTASAANLEIPSRSFSTAIWSSLKKKRNSASLLMYVFFSRSNFAASLASSFWGISSCELYSCSSRLG